MNTKANWNISLDVTCPKCDEFVDLTSESDFWDCRSGIEKYLNYEGLEVICPICRHEFVVDCEY